MSEPQPPSPPPNPSPQPPAPGGGGGNRGAIIAIIGVVLVVGIVVAVVESRGKQPTPLKDGPIPGLPPPVTQPTGAFDTPNRPEPTYAALEEAPAQDTPELFWLSVANPRQVHQTLRSNAWLGKAMKDPVGQGFVAAWGGFFGTRGEDIGKAFSGAVADLVLDQVLGTPYRIVWYGGEGAKGAPAVIVPSPGGSAVTAFDTLVQVAASGGFDPPSCVKSAGAGADGGASAESIHRIVLADKIVFAAKLADRIVLAPRPQAAMLAMCHELSKGEPKAGVAVSLGFSLGASGRGTQSLGAVLGVGDVAELDFGVESDGFVPKGLGATLDGPGRLAAVEPSQDLLKAIPERSGVVLFLAVKLPKELTATALRDTLGADGEDFKKTRKEWPAGDPRQVAVVWNPRGNRNTEVAVLWANVADEQALAGAMTKGNGALQAGKACSVLAYASTKELMADLQASCSGKKPSLMQAAQPVVKGLTQNASLALTVNLGRVLSQLTIDGWLSEHPTPNATTGPQEIEAARKLLEELPTVGFRATVGADGKVVSGGFRS
ncbi:MAG: hypothetical protein JNJ54_28320 [Myxococcaceae bacterium]|nr:hypothetical protein [Myxococcaceae bacterium]